jgi:conjugative relaxase-like TrwC/TraI family protein
MLRIIPSRSAAQAKAYFTDALSKSDYYTGNDQGVELQGNFRGKLAERLGLSGPTTKEAFFALCENRHPQTGKKLTPRTKDERLTGWDMNWHAPKSVSILHALSQDNHIIDAFQASVHESMQDIEKDIKTRIRKGGEQEDRDTGEMIWSEFVHQTARPVEGHVCDPHIHIHGYVHNLAFDPIENRFKAAKVREVFRSKDYYTARFQKRFADRLVILGYQIRRTAHSFEIVGVPQAAIDHFSKRTDEIGRAAKKLGITDAKALDALGAKTRSKKQKGLTMAELKTNWKLQLRKLTQDLQLDQNAPIRFAPVKTIEPMKAHQAIDHSLAHSFERASVMSERKLLAESFRHALGEKELSLDEITASFVQDKRLLRIKQGEQNLCTTHAILKEEKYMIDLARGGHGKFRPLYAKAPATKLKDQQEAAVKHILSTPNQISIVIGSAGVGKTYMMKEAAELIKAAGKKLTVVAPTTNASRGVLVEDGFKDATTVAALLSSPDLQKRLKDQVLWVDEAGLLSVQDTIKILELAKAQNARVIFGGDTRQHSAIARGQALKILNTVGGIRAAEVSKIRRQKDKPLYLDAVQAFALGEVKSGFEKLDAMQAIKEIDPLSGKEELANDYFAAAKKGKSVLIISPTHKEGEAVTDVIRTRMRAAGMIGKKELSAFRYMNLNMTEAEKSDHRNFQPGQVVQFHQNRKGIKRGSQWRVAEVTDRDVYILDVIGRKVLLPKERTKDFSVFRTKPLALSKGDKVMITHNGFDKKDKRLNNGTAFTVASISKKGEIILQNKESKTKYSIGEDFGHINHAYSLTSYASQGKTVDHVLVWQSAATFSATDAKQFYVSVSRGKTNVSIYTDDKAALLDHASELGDRQSALELVNADSRHKAHVELKQRSERSPPDKSKVQDKTLPHHHKTIDRDYEPGL